MTTSSGWALTDLTEHSCEFSHILPQACYGPVIGPTGRCGHWVQVLEAWLVRKPKKTDYGDSFEWNT